MIPLIVGNIPKKNIPKQTEVVNETSPTSTFQRKDVKQYVSANGVNDDLLNTLNQAIDLFKRDNPNAPIPVVTSGYRSIEKQTQLWNNRHNNPYPVARPGTSKHNHGTAVDVSFPIKDQKQKHQTLDTFYNKYVKQVNPNIVWGGHFSKYDPVHFELGQNKSRTNSPAKPYVPAVQDKELNQIIMQNKPQGVDSNSWQRLINSQIKKESGGKNNAVSPKQAKGLMQLMDATARSYGVTDPFDSKQNINAGTKFLADLYKQYGDMGAALAHYNGGGRPAKEYLNRRNVNDISFKETRDYVQKLLPMFKYGGIIGGTLGAIGGSFLGNPMLGFTVGSAIGNGVDGIIDERKNNKLNNKVQEVDTMTKTINKGFYKKGGIVQRYKEGGVTGDPPNYGALLAKYYRKYGEMLPPELRNKDNKTKWNYVWNNDNNRAREISGLRSNQNNNLTPTRTNNQTSNQEKINLQNELIFYRSGSGKLYNQKEVYDGLHLNNNNPTSQQRPQQRSIPSIPRQQNNRSQQNNSNNRSQQQTNTNTSNLNLEQVLQQRRFRNVNQYKTDIEAYFNKEENKALSSKLNNSQKIDLYFEAMRNLNPNEAKYKTVQNRSGQKVIPPKFIEGEKNQYEEKPTSISTNVVPVIEPIKVPIIGTEYIRPKTQPQADNSNIGIRTQGGIKEVVKNINPQIATINAEKKAIDLMQGVYAKGGFAQKLKKKDDAVEFKGKSHQQGGIDLPFGEVEGGETMDVLPDGRKYIFSKQLKLPNSNISFADYHKALVKKGASDQDVLNLAKMQDDVNGKEEFANGGTIAMQGLQYLPAIYNIGLGLTMKKPKPQVPTLSNRSHLNTLGSLPTKINVSEQQNQLNKSFNTALNNPNMTKSQLQGLYTTKLEQDNKLLADKQQKELELEVQKANVVASNIGQLNNNDVNLVNSYNQLNKQEEDAFYTNKQQLIASGLSNILDVSTGILEDKRLEKESLAKLTLGLSAMEEGERKAYLNYMAKNMPEAYKQLFGQINLDMPSVQIPDIKKDTSTFDSLRKSILPITTTIPKLESKITPQVQPTKSYTIKYGGTLADVARVNNVSLEDLIKLNPELINKRLTVGQTVKLN